MSSLTLIEKRSLEKLFNMSGGIPLNFSDRTIEDFFIDVVSIDIHLEKYQGKGTSKAKKLREFWRLESDHLVGKVILALIDYGGEFKFLPLTEFGKTGEVISKEDLKDLIKQCKKIGNRLLAGKINLNPLKETSVVFNAKHLGEQIRRMEESVETDPSLAIGTAKELIETCCKTILAERGIKISKNPDISNLTKETLKALKLVPDGIPESARGSDVIKRLLNNLGTIGNSLAELRGLYGTGHGKDGKFEGLTPRHAKLAVGAASTLANFLFDTHKEK